MSKHSDPLLAALQAGKSYTWTVPDGGDFACQLFSCQKAVEFGKCIFVVFCIIGFG